MSVAPVPGPADASGGNALLTPVATPAAAADPGKSPLDVLKDSGSVTSSAKDFLDAAKDAKAPILDDDRSKMAAGGLGFAGDMATGVKGIGELAKGDYLQGAVDTGKGVIGGAGDIAKMVGDSKAADALGSAGKVAGQAGAALNMAKDGAALADGVNAIRKADNGSDGVDAVLKTADAATSTVGDVGKVMGEKVPGLDYVKAGLDVAHTGKDIYDIAADHDSLPAGQSRKDGADATIDAIDHGLHAASEIGGLAGGAVGAVSKSLGVGMDVGNVIAPYVFGDMSKTGSHTEHIETNADGSEQKFHASTGNGVIDWMAGVGKYTDGRF